MAPDRFLDAVQSLVDEPIGAELLGVGPVVAIAALRDSTFALLVSARLGDLAEIEGVFRDFLDSNNSSNLKLVIVGGGPEHRELLERMQPRVMLGRVIQAFAIDDSGALWAGARSRVDSPLGAALTAVGARAEPREVDRAALAARVSVPTAEERAQAHEAHTFVQSTRTGVPIATITILGLIAVTFGLEWLWGGPLFLPTLLRMGANTSASLEGEPWRMLASAWLHAGLLHVLVNSYVLYSLGGFLERMLGPARFVTLYVTAALGGSLASAALSSSLLSVGASGAIWGVLGASIALAWRPAGLVPDAVLPTFRRNAIVNVVINLAISFIPQVDAMAHFGGGLVGAALVFSGLVTRGVTTTPRPHRYPWGFAAVVASIVMIAAPVLAFVHGRPWALNDAHTATHELGGGATIELPVAFGDVTIEHAESPTVVQVGDLFKDRAALTIAIVRHGGELQFPDGLDEAFAEFQELPTEPPEGATVVGDREIIEGERHRGFLEHYQFANGMDLLVIFQLRTTTTVRIEAVFWAERPEIEGELRVAASTLWIP